jgi:hypothetical protein
MTQSPPRPDEECDRHIGAEGTEPPGAPRRSGEARLRDPDEALDAALACTFPASDPVSCFRPGADCASDS